MRDFLANSQSIFLERVSQFQFIVQFTKNVLQFVHGVPDNILGPPVWQWLFIRKSEDRQFTCDRSKLSLRWFR